MFQEKSSHNRFLLKLIPNYHNYLRKCSFWVINFSSKCKTIDLQQKLRMAWTSLNMLEKMPLYHNDWSIYCKKISSWKIPMDSILSKTDSKRTRAPQRFVDLISSRPTSPAHEHYNWQWACLFLHWLVSTLTCL